MKILSKREIQNIAINHSSDVDFKDFMITYNKCNPKSLLF